MRLCDILISKLFFSLRKSNLYEKDMFGIISLCSTIPIHFCHEFLDPKTKIIKNVFY